MEKSEEVKKEGGRERGQKMEEGRKQRKEGGRRGCIQKIPLKTHEMKMLACSCIGIIYILGINSSWVHA